MSPRPAREKTDPRLLVRFCTLVLETPQTPELIARVAADADFVRLCRQVVAQDDADFIARYGSVCGRCSMDRELVRSRLLPVARALHIFVPNQELAADRALLGVSPDADPEALRQAFRKQAMRLHPDKKGGDADGFMALKGAYGRLMEEAAGAGPGQGAAGEAWVESPLGAAVHAMAPAAGKVRGGRWLLPLTGLVLALLALAFGFEAYYKESAVLNGPNVIVRPIPSQEASPGGDPRVPQVPAGNSVVNLSIFYSDPRDLQLAQALAGVLKRWRSVVVSINRVHVPGMENRLHFHPDDREAAEEILSDVRRYLKGPGGSDDAFLRVNREVVATEAGDRSRGSMALYLPAPVTAACLEAGFPASNTECSHTGLDY